MIKRCYKETERKIKRGRRQKKDLKKDKKKKKIKTVNVMFEIKFR